MTGPKPYKVWNSSRSLRKAVVASTLCELIEKGSDKLGIPQAQVSKVVLEEDGTQVDDEDYFQYIESNAVFLLLREGELWQNTVDGSLDETDAADDTGLDSDLLSIIQGLRQDLSRIILFTDIQLQSLVDTDTQVLARYLKESETFAKAVQEACQEHLYHRDQTHETAGLIKLFQDAQRAHVETKEPNMVKQPEEASISNADLGLRATISDTDLGVKRHQPSKNSRKMAKRAKKTD